MKFIQDEFFIAPELLPLYSSTQGSSPARKIPVLDFYFNPREITWKGQTVRVEDYDLFVLVIQGWMSTNNLTKEQALDEFFFM